MCIRDRLSSGRQLYLRCAWDLACRYGPVRERGPSTMLFSDDLPKGLSEPVFQSGELNIIKGLTGRKPETGCFAWRFSKKQAPTKTGESYSKPETGCFARRSCHSENRKTAGPPRSQSKVVFSRGASRETGSDQEY